MDLDNLFGGAGDDSGLPSTNHTQPVEPTTETTEPVTEPAATEPQAPASTPITEFVLKTNTGTVYKSIEEAAKGIEQKDQLIANLRQMVSAVTGEDPLNRKSGQPTTTQPRTGYLQDPNRFAQDLTQAATNKDWNKYLQTQLAPVREYIEQQFGPYLPALQNVGKQQALDSITRTVPDFKQFYGSDSYNKVMEARPRLANAIKFAESNNLQEDLQELYQIAHDQSVAMRMPELVKAQQTARPQTPVPRTPASVRTMTAPTVRGDSSLSGREPAQPGMSTPAGRKALMAELEAKGVLDSRF